MAVVVADLAPSTGNPPQPPAGLAVLFERHRPELVRFLTARCGDFNQAEDLIQDLWLKVGAVTPGPIANGRAYLFRMANNLMLDTLRGRRRAMARDHGWLDAQEGGALTPDLRPDPAPSAEEAISTGQERDVLMRAIDGLPPGAARALRLHRFEGLGQGEVAQAMGISRSGVEKHLATAMRHLRAALADCGMFTPVASSQQEEALAETVRPDTRP